MSNWQLYEIKFEVSLSHICQKTTHIVKVADKSSEKAVAFLKDSVRTYGLTKAKDPKSKAAFYPFIGMLFSMYDQNPELRVARILEVNELSTIDLI